MLDAIARTSTSSTPSTLSMSSADPDALAFLARSLWEFGNATQQQTNQLYANRQSANHGNELGKLASRLTQSGNVTDLVSRDFASADHRGVSRLLGMHRAVRARPIANNAKNFAPRGAKRVVVGPKVGAADCAGRGKGRDERL